jgi:hypothetical protein
MTDIIDSTALYEAETTFNLMRTSMNNTNTLTVDSIAFEDVASDLSNGVPLSVEMLESIFGDVVYDLFEDHSSAVKV